MAAWLEDDDVVDDQVSLATHSLYLPAVQTLPTIASAESSDDDDDIIENMVFSSTQHASTGMQTENTYSGPTQEDCTEKQESCTGNMLTNARPTSANSHGDYANPMLDDSQLPGPQQQQAASASAANMSASLSSFIRLAGAAGQLAGLQHDKSQQEQLSDAGLCQTSSASNSWQDEAEVEQSFQHALLQDAEAASQASGRGVQIDAAVQQLDIDSLLRKLVCGDLEYDPHDPHSNLPPADSLYSDDEPASSGSSRRSSIAGQHIDDKGSLQLPAFAVKSQYSVLTPSSRSRHDCHAAESTRAEQVVLNKGSPKQLPRAATQVSKQLNDGPQIAKQQRSIHFRHRQVSRLADRFHRQASQESEGSVEEEFENWREGRAAIKSRSIC